MIDSSGGEVDFMSLSLFRDAIFGIKINSVIEHQCAKRFRFVPASLVMVYKMTCQV